ncbi:microsomal glutathione S-transferase 3-like protein [Apostichopus japonicus]|uniref:Microsomal glutathione S-transferase 3-like protein n=1 Tax=Stichopus japonicus TaxID=307972 RepID=A0A2G8L3A4_STIJA|nr:microsomal glutathione S-transferase 3-like protein [Apostichopus japonicus]
MPGTLSTLSDDYGYVILVGAGSFFVNMWLSRNVIKARKEFKVEKMLLPKQSENKSKSCVEIISFHAGNVSGVFCHKLFIGGTNFPRLASGFGIIYLAGRVAYAKGYYTGEPKNRFRGRFMAIGFLGLLGLNIATGLRQLGFFATFPAREWGFRNC